MKNKNLDSFYSIVYPDFIKEFPHCHSELVEDSSQKVYTE